MKTPIIALSLMLSTTYIQAQTTTGQSTIKNGLQVQYTITKPKSSDDDKATILIVLKQNNQIITSKTYQQPTYNLTVTEATLMDNKGLSGTKNIIHISHNADADEIPVDNYFWAWTGQRLITLPSTQELYAADQGSSTAELIFPSDKEGIANTIRKVETTIGPDSKKTHRTEKRFAWHGKDITSKN